MGTVKQTLKKPNYFSLTLLLHFSANQGFCVSAWQNTGESRAEVALWPYTRTGVGRGQEAGHSTYYLLYLFVWSSPGLDRSKLLFI